MPQGYKTELMQYVITYIKENNDLSFYEKGVDVLTCPQNSHQKPKFWTIQNQTIGRCQKS